MNRRRRWRYNWESPMSHAVTLVVGLVAGYLLWVYLAASLAGGRG